MVTLVVFGAGVAEAGVWPQEKGKGYMALSFTYLRYHEVINGSLFDNNGFEKLELHRTVSDHTLNGYFEYGITNRLTAIGNVPFKLLKTSEELRSTKEDLSPSDTIAAGSFNTLGNVDLGARYLIHEGDFLWSIQLMSGLKTASYRHESGLRSGYAAWYLTPQVQFGRSWGQTYFSSSLGYRYKTNGYADDLVTDHEIGYQWARPSGHPTWFIFTFGAELPLTEGNFDDQNSSQTGLYRDEEGFVDPGIKINHYFSDHWAVNLSSIGAIWARHGGNELTFTAGVSYDW